MFRENKNKVIGSVTVGIRILSASGSDLSSSGYTSLGERGAHSVSVSSLSMCSSTCDLTGNDVISDSTTYSSSSDSIGNCKHDVTGIAGGRYVTKNGSCEAAGNVSYGDIAESLINDSVGLNSDQYITGNVHYDVVESVNSGITRCVSRDVRRHITDGDVTGNGSMDFLSVPSACDLGGIKVCIFRTNLCIAHNHLLERATLYS